MLVLMNACLFLLVGKFNHPNNFGSLQEAWCV